MLPKTSEYALRAMAHLATLPPQTAAASADLAETARIPRHYVSKLMRRLVVADLVASQRGHGGGFTLTRAPEAIHFIEILQAVNFLGDTDSCVFGWEECRSDDPCPLHSSWTVLKASFLSWAQDTTLANVRDNWVKTGEVQQSDTLVTLKKPVS
ncbi:MAG: Rrf2 family transcriptional regulator [Deltaproteobacteria bacterium]|nr:Rrf2 family transcriptional regulator [Deltaproteobacteria bacterium]